MNGDRAALAILDALTRAMDGDAHDPPREIAQARAILDRLERRARVLRLTIEAVEGKIRRGGEIPANDGGRPGGAT